MINKLPDRLEVCISEFKKFTDKTIKKFSEANFLNAVYHYTSSDGLLGIIESEKLRLTHSSYLNDPTEILYGHEKIINYANKYNEKSKDNRLEFFWSRFSGPFYDVRKKLEVFVCSFSCAQNDLTQWRSYANNGHGFCLEFNSGLFNEVPSEYQSERIIFNKLRYGEDSVKKLTMKLLIKLKNLYCVLFRQIIPQKLRVNLWRVWQWKLLCLHYILACWLNILVINLKKKGACFVWVKISYLILGLRFLLKEI